MKKRRIPFADTIKSYQPLKLYFMENRWALLLGFMSLLAVDFLQLLIPLVIKRAIDSLTTQTATAQILFQLGLLIVGIAGMLAAFRYLWRRLIFGHARKVEERLRNRLYRHLQTLSYSFYQRIKTGDLMARAVNDINSVRMATGMGLVAFTDGAVLGMAAIGFMLSISAKLTLIALIPAPIIVVLSKILTRRMSSGFESVQKTFSDLTERVREAFSGIRVIKAYNREKWEYERLRDEGRRYMAENMDLAKTLGLFFPMMTVLSNAGLAIVIWAGGRLTILGDITTGEFVAFISYLNLLTWPMMAMGWVTNLIQRGSASMRRINRILHEVPEIQDGPQRQSLLRIAGSIDITNLTFTHHGQKKEALKKICFKVDAGETVAIVGRVGSGKTTLLHLIPRLLDAPPGTVLIDGRDIRLISLKDLRKSMGFVTQEVFLFSDTIRNNVVFGRDGLSQESLERALKGADILEEILQLENGVNTMLGERGITLSGGQRQRLTIARALIEDPPILIMDDALSMVDTRTEKRILNQILSMRCHKTNIIVSHRVSTLTRADRIVVLDDGRVVEQGSHEGLLEQQGLYTALYERQLLSSELEHMAEADGPECRGS